MVSRVRWLVAVAVAVVATATPAAPVPVPGEGKYEPPTATAHTLPGAKVLADVKAYAKLIGGEAAVKKLDEMLVELFGKATLPGLDLTRPACAYLYLRANLEESSGVLVIPTTSEKEALALLEKMGISAKVDRATPGRHKLVPEDPNFPLPLYAQFADGGKLLYVSVNAKPDVLEKDKLIPVAKLVDPKATTHLTLTAYPDRVPNAARQMVFDFIDLELMAELDRMEQRKPRDMPPSFPTFMKELLKLGKRSLASLFTECDRVTVGGHLNAKSGNVETETVIVPKANTAFATDIAAIKAPVGRFHQLTTKDSVLGGWAVLPTPLPKELRTHGGAFLKEWAGILKNGAPKSLDDLFEAIGEQVSKAVTGGKVDGGFGLAGPNKADLYTGVAAVAVDDAAVLEKAARAAVKALPADAAAMIKFDAMKVEGVAVHTVSAGDGIGPDLQRIFGADAKLHVAFGKDAVYAAVGPDAEAELKRAMGLKPATATAFDLTAHGARAVKLLTADRFNGPVVELGKRIDDFVSYVGADVTGGKELRVKAKSGAPLMAFLFFARAEFGEKAAPIPKK